MDDMLGLQYPIRGYEGEFGEEIGALSIDEVNELKTPFLTRAIALYSEWQTFGVLPHGKGTLDESPAYLRAMSILKEEETLWQAYEMEQRNRSK